MGRMNELSQALDEMIACGEGMIRAANAIKEMFMGTEEAETAAPTKTEPEKTETKTYTFAEVRKAFSAKSHAGYTVQVKALISKYGAEKLSGIKKEDYPALMAELEVIG